MRTQNKLKIGNTTGFQRQFVDVLLRDAAKQGYVPDASVAGDEVSKPRPWPFMMHRNMELLGVGQPWLVAKVDDTVDGIGEADNAGAWGVAVGGASNYMNIDSYEHWNKMPRAERHRRYGASKAWLLQRARPHYYIPTIRQLPAVVQHINARLAHGRYPWHCREATVVMEDDRVINDLLNLQL